MNQILELMTPVRFLTLSGIVLTVLGAFGISGVLRKISSAGLFNSPQWINWAHLAGGLALLLVAFAGGSLLQRGIVLFGAISGTLLGALGLLFGRYAGRHLRLPQLADKSEHGAHLAVGLLASWALWH
jgi:hypothetical protein